MKNYLFIISLLFFKISFSQDVSIKDMGILKGNISLDTIKVDRSNLTILVFYKSNIQKKNCEKSIIYNVGGCNKSTFIEKLRLLLNQSTTFKRVRIKIYELPLDKTLYFTDKDNGKVPISDLTGILYGFDSYLFNKESDFLKFLLKINNFASFNLNSQSNLIVKSIFEFDNKIRKQDNKIFKTPKNIFVLSKDSININISCPALDIPEDDIFLEHLNLLFKPNLVLSKILESNEKNQNITELKIDSLIQILTFQKQEIDKLKIQNTSNNNRVSFFSHYSFLNISSSSNNLSSILKTRLFNRLGITYSRTISSGIGFGVSVNNINARGTLNTTDIDIEHQEVLPSSSILMNRRTEILNLSENWHLQNLIGLNIGLNLKKDIGKKLNLQMDIQIGKILTSDLNTTLEEGVFNYRASIPGIIDEIIDVASLNLKDDVSYSEKYNQKFGFTGSNLCFNTAVDYSVCKNIFIHGGFQFEYYRLKNTSYNADSKVSTSLGEFNSSFNNVKSITLLPFSLGLGVGIKF